MRFVEKAVGVSLDFTPETLPVLDHYLREARDLGTQRPESLPLLVATAGAYLGELLRRRHGCAWNQDDPDPLGWFLVFDDDLLTVFPVAMAQVAAVGEEADRELEFIRFRDEERELVVAHLAELPPVTDEEYLAPSTRVEIIDMAIDLIRAYREARDQEPAPDPDA